MTVPPPSAPGTPGGLARRLGTFDAVVVGLSSMLGAGVFVVFGPAARAAGSALLVGLVVAGAVAYANATASGQLAAAYPLAGGTYTYGRERLGPWWGFAAGWSFVVGKTASCAVMATTVATYLVPDSWWRRVVAAAVVIALGVVNALGVTRTARTARVLLVVTLLVLGAFVVGGAAGADHPPVAGGTAHGVVGVLQSAGLLFFAFAGYARIATLGEEVREPRSTIPRAIAVSLAVAAVVYLAVALVVLAALGPDGTAASHAPVADAAAAVAPGLEPWVRVGAVAASLGSLLALLAGIGRTSLAMAREHDLPRPLAVVHPARQVPARAELVVTALVVLLVLTTDLTGVLAFSSFGVLLYYAIANLSAWTQTGPDRRSPRALQVFGLVGCVVLALTLPLAGVAGGLAVLAVGLLGRAVVARRRARAD
ncbi:APC family permease [Cellulomonas alba]|uniref:APC family permease n=1 Tax=Cellulomonas alba TaxID=3053467 RepID=A0ABT7SEK5_9CELL|nr:APC family permease [Cellulomonas alba]MDM7854615.1 APC family permease [Cellulomonas alba]